MDRQRFIDGRETAGWAAAEVKQNKQVAGDSTDYPAMQAMVADALAANRFFAMAAMPRTMRPILFSRYTAGMSYGPHVDNALMGDAPRSEEHTSELQSLMRSSYAVFCLKKKKHTNTK